jgi:uncharacterized protein HemX
VTVAGKGIVTVIFFAAVLLGLVIVLGSWQLGATRKARVAVTKDQEYGRLANEYRRLAEMAITAQEHSDLKLAEINGRLGQLHNQLESVQRILKDVE